METQLPFLRIAGSAGWEVLSAISAGGFLNRVEETVMTDPEDREYFL